MQILDAEEAKKIINLSELDDPDLILNDPLLSSFPLFDTPPPSSHHSNSTPSSPSSISTASTTSKRSSSSRHKNSPSFNFQASSDDDEFDVCEPRKLRKRNKNSESRTNALSLRDPMMSASHSPTHFSSDLCSYMDQMFFSSSQFFSPGLAADDTIDLCSILKTENSLGYDRDPIML